MDYLIRIDLQNKDHWNNTLVWCNENIGEVKVKWAAINYNDVSATFMFKHEDDYTAFKLTWIG